MTLDRRTLFSAGAGLGLAAVGTHATVAGPRKPAGARGRAFTVALEAGTQRDQTAVLQRAIDQAAGEGIPLMLPPGRFVVDRVTLRSGSHLIGAEGLTTLVALGDGPVLRAEGAEEFSLRALRVEGARKASRLIELWSCKCVVVEDVVLSRARTDALVMEDCSGRITHCRIDDVGDAAIFCRDGRGVEIANNQISRCANNGIQVWRTDEGRDGARVVGNLISNISSHRGGTGQNGNGINIFRAGDVLIGQNRISDCAYSAIRGNAASNIQMIGNSCSGIGEVALYAEFGFRGAVICSNVVDTSATGISITNLDHGGGLATVQGNLVRNLFRREHERVDKRGHGITVEADASVTGNTIEAAATAGIAIGWGAFLRDVAVTGNVIRKSAIGVAVSSDENAGACLIANNMISGAVDGAIRAMNHGVAHGSDLAKSAITSERLSINGNLAV